MRIDTRGVIRHSAEYLLEELTDRVPDEDVAFLDARGRRRGDAQAHIAKVPHLATVGARETHDRHALAARGLDRAQDVAAVAARRDGEQHVAFAPVSGDLAGKDLVVAGVVADRGERGRVRVEGEGGERLPIAEESSRQLRRDVLRI